MTMSKQNKISRFNVWHLFKRWRWRKNINKINSVSLPTTFLCSVTTELSCCAKTGFKMAPNSLEYWTENMDTSKNWTPVVFQNLKNNLTKFLKIDNYVRRVFAWWFITSLLDLWIICKNISKNNILIMSW